MNSFIQLPIGMHFLERGWLSSNSLLLTNANESCLVDSGFWTHAPQTIQLVKSVLGNRHLNTIINTHLHSDHCGGNAALQVVWPDLRIGVGSSQYASALQWDADALSYEVTGQYCPRFTPHFSYSPAQNLILSGVPWTVYAGAGHDPHSMLLFQEEHRLLITADALWENGFGVVFPELEGASAFDDVLQTLDLIESLNPLVCLPGHGRMFTDLQASLQVARSRCHHFKDNPKKHAVHAAKVLIKYRLLELQFWELNELQSWAVRVPYLRRIQEDYFSKNEFKYLINEWIQGLVSAKVARIEGATLYNL